VRAGSSPAKSLHQLWLTNFEAENKPLLECGTVGYKKKQGAILTMAPCLGIDPSRSASAT